MKKATLTKNTILGLLVSVLLIGNTVSPVMVAAIDVPLPPDVPQNTVPVPTAPPTPDVPTAPTPPIVEVPVAPSPLAVPTIEELIAQQEENQHAVAAQAENEEENEDDTNGNTDSGANSTQNSAPALGETTGSQDESHGDGDNSIETGIADASALLINNANTNISASGNGADDISVGNSGNGANSNNSAGVNTNNNSDTIQTNGADVDNGVNLGAVSGNNDTSYNIGDSSIISGDANATATVINGVNTNIDGVSVVEFNVDDTHTGDIVLVFPENSGSCSATVCNTNGNAKAENSGNGSDSTNDAGIKSTNSDASFQNNAADVTNDVVLVADSGNNDASYNTGGDSVISTGNANAVATVGNFVNNNISGAGEVLIAVVNIFGDLIGNILLPESTVANSGNSGSTTAANSGNGENSTNTAGIDMNNSGFVSQNNNAAIANNIDVAATTGNNSVEKNTAGFSSGDNVIETGDASVDVNAVTIANNNVLDGATWWLVFVNDAEGNWIGKIMGAPDGATMAGSAGTEFIVNADGTISARNSGNGSGSSNDATVASSNTNSVVQNNNATITNNISLTANSGKNDASHNTGGSSSIKTGDANIMANIVTFANNNFVGGKVVVSIINVFGSWLGSFVPAGQQAPQLTTNIGGAQLNEGQNHTSGNGGNGASQNTQNGNSQSTSANSGVTLGTGTEARFSGFATQVALGTSDAVDANVGGLIENDDFMSVPEPAKVAGARSTHLDTIWKVVGLGLALLIIRSIMAVIAKRNTFLLSK